MIVSHLKIKSLLDEPQIQTNDDIGLQHYNHQQVKITNPWLLSMGYKNPIVSYENLWKVYFLRMQFFKVTYDYD